MLEKSKQISLGIFQGRLSPSRGHGIQFFPFETWREEFTIAERLGLNEIEFIFDKERYEENPLWTTTGIKEIKKLVRTHGVRVNHICADYFMRDPFFRVPEEIKEQSVIVLKRLIDAGAEIGARNIEIPLVDNSSIKTKGEERELIEAVGRVLPDAKMAGITIGLETDLPPKKFLKLIEGFGSKIIKANYDTGNSASLGYDTKEEIRTYGKHIANIHIKDRKYGGSTVLLGTGDADFKSFFESLKKTGYRESFILQVARGEDGQETKTVAKQMEFVRRYINEYLA